MTTARKTWLGAIAAVALATLGFYAYQVFIIGSAYVAHMLCSGVFVAGRTEESVIASDLSLAAPPGTRWRYSSATTNVITGAMRRVLGDAYLGFPRRALFERIGMRSAVLEVDQRGNFIGSSFMWATARDWARLGQLYLDDGMGNGERILPEGWVTYSRTPAPAAPDRRYGAHFWLKIAGNYGGDVNMPADAFHAIGHEGQFVTIIPSRRVVIVRLGLTRTSGAWAHDEFVARVLHALHD